VGVLTATTDKWCLIKWRFKWRSCSPPSVHSSTGHITLYTQRTGRCTQTHTHTQVFIRLQGSRKLHLATCWISQLLTTSQHHSPTWILPRNHTNIRMHSHTTPTHIDLYTNDAVRI